MTRAAHEVNFDGLVGPTHNYAGLSYGNLASMEHRLATSNPRAAALQGLEKMKRLHDMGLLQAVLPPHERPHVPTLKDKGYAGRDVDILEAVRHDNPDLLLACYSASSMWTANAATVSPSADTSDERVHITPANLRSQFHRSIETPFTAAVLKKIFSTSVFVHHDPLPDAEEFGDEGAANHLRLCTAHGDRGLEIFVFGRSAAVTGSVPSRFPARQTREASEAVARQHELSDADVLFIQQNPALIDAGVFHNDVISVADRNLLFMHEEAFLDGVSALRERLGDALEVITVTSSELSPAECVESYLFNSQLVTLPDGARCLVAPVESRDRSNVKACIDRILEEGHAIQSVEYIDLTQSMMNGGGPACLRLRVVLTDEELAQTHEGVLLNDNLYGKLTAWVSKHYRDKLEQDDLVDPQLLEETRCALDELTQVLALGPIYSFQ